MHKCNLSIGLILIVLVILTPILSIANDPINFTKAQSNAPELTGTYKANDGGTYYIRQLGNDLVWAGVSSDDGHEWTNVFVGKVNGDTINGNWADVPRGHLQGSGTLTLKFTVSEFRINIQKTGGTGDFSGSQWEKVAAVITSPPQKSSTESTQQNSGHQYIVKLDSTYITSKRAAVRDTDFVALAAKVNDQQPITNSKKLGDLDSGFLHPINIQVGPITVKQGQVLSFDYVITNKHDGDSSTLSTLASAVAGILTKLFSNSNPITAISFPFIEKLVEQALPGWFVAGSCDGVVAADNVIIPSDMLEQWTKDTGSHQEKRDYYGGDTPVGCGSNSHYDIRWTVTKVS
jgi:hypothetical protein